MAVTKLDLYKDFPESPFPLIGRRWALLSAGKDAQCNTMTVSWGQLGVLWNKNVATVYVRPQRHTLSFLQKNDTFTLSFFPEEYRRTLSFCGAHSGRDCDKIKESGLTPVFENETVWFEQASLVLICRKLYCQQMCSECFCDPSVSEKNYSANDYHFCFIGEITDAFTQE